jgi:hypothetical protein
VENFKVLQKKKKKGMTVSLNSFIETIRRSLVLAPDTKEKDKAPRLDMSARVSSSFD